MGVDKVAAVLVDICDFGVEWGNSFWPSSDSWKSSGVVECFNERCRLDGPMVCWG